MTKMTTYPSFDGKSLNFKIFFPSNFDYSRIYPGAVLFFGGGWMTGTIDQFKTQAEEMSKEGFVVFTPYYRVFENDGTTIDVALQDVKAFLNFLYEHQKQYFLDITNIILAGASAGGHLVLSQILFDEYKGNINPKGLVLFNPVVDTTANGYQSIALTKADSTGEKFSPMLRNRKLPPMLIFHGTEDTTIRFNLAKNFVDNSKLLGTKAELIAFPNRTHGFFNLRKDNDPEDYYITLQKMIEFSLNCINVKN